MKTNPHLAARPWERLKQEVVLRLLARSSNIERRIAALEERARKEAADVGAEKLRLV